MTASIADLWALYFGGTTDAAYAALKAYADAGIDVLDVLAVASGTDTAEIVDGAVTTAKLHDDAVTSAKIADGTIVNADINASAAIAETKLSLASDAAAGTASRRTLGTSATSACAGNDSRLSDTRTPTSHGSTHLPGGADDIGYYNQQPRDQGLLAWAFPSEIGVAGSTNTYGYVVLTKVKVPKSITVSNILCGVSGAPTSLTSGQCFAGIYSSAGTLLGRTADQSAVWNTTGGKTMALASPAATVDITGGPDVWVWVGFLANGTGTPPAFTSLSPNGNGAAYQLGLTVSTALSAYYPSGGAQTSLPTPITPANNTFYQNRTWAALS